MTFAFLPGFHPVGGLDDTLVLPAIEAQPTPAPRTAYLGSTFNGCLGVGRVSISVPGRPLIRLPRRADLGGEQTAERRWGYLASPLRCRELAIDLLAHAAGPKVATRFHKDLADRIAEFGGASWRLTAGELLGLAAEGIRIDQIEHLLGRGKAVI